jgi:hypothetical protein
LNPKHGGSERPLDPDWAVSYDYVMPTTLFVFADYFAWVRLLQESLSLELFDSQTARGEFSASIWSVSKTLSDWPGKAPESKGQDSQVFALQQRAIGELLIRRDGQDVSTMTSPEFMTAYEAKPDFKAQLEPLRRLLDSIEPDTKRWIRLEATLRALREFDRRSRELLDITPRRSTA